MRKLISTRSERQQQIDQIVDKAKYDQSLDNDFIFDEEVYELSSPEHQLEEPLNSSNKDIRHDAFNYVTVAENPTNPIATLDFPSNDCLQEEHSINENIHNNETVVREITQTTDYDNVTIENSQYEPQDITYICKNIDVPTDLNNVLDASKDNENNIKMQETEL